MKRSKFNLSHYKLLSMNQGFLVPITWMETLPGDSIQHATSILCRVSPLLAPIMHPVHMRVHHWFVPLRLIWTDWEKFITGGADGDDATDPPVIACPDTTGFPQSGLMDYLGIPPGVDFNGNVSALPPRAAQLVWNEWYRDQDLQTPLVISKGNGLDTTTDLNLQRVAWEKDYFTLARTEPQKGSDVTIPLGGTAGVRRVDSAPNAWTTYQPGTNLDTAQGSWGLGPIGSDSGPAISGAGMSFDPRGGLETDLSDITNPATVNDFRRAFAINRFMEARSRYGSRYTEYLAYLGVRSSDARLQRPEYLGGGKETVQFSEVLQTGVTTDGDDSEGVGNLKGHGIGSLRSNRYRRFFEEHGIIISFLSVKPKTVYTQGIHRGWSRFTKYDYWQKELQHVGQQDILNREIYAAHTNPLNTFGYVDRYSEYRKMPSTVAGEFRSTLDFWHQARKFSSDPALNASFIAANPTDRIYASTDTDELYVMANHNVQARRLISRNSSGLII